MVEWEEEAQRLIFETWVTVSAPSAGKLVPVGRGVENLQCVVNSFN